MRYETKIKVKNIHVCNEMTQVFAQVFLLKRKNEENDQNEMISLKRRCIFLISCRSTMEKEQFTIYFVFGFFLLLL